MVRLFINLQNFYRTTMIFKKENAWRKSNPEQRYSNVAVDLKKNRKFNK